ncbi:MAG: ABC transporter substrate-binding protein [Thermodesulfobacteriota bacterium]|jgi:phospholipid transport system substrate-binding protein
MATAAEHHGEEQPTVPCREGLCFMAPRSHTATSPRLRVFKSLMAALLLFLPASAPATESPLEAIRATINQVIPILQDAAHQGEDRRQARIEKVWEIVEPRFDLHELARRALGVHWQQLTDEERREFVRLFTQLVEATYSGTIARYTSDVQFFFDRERIEGDFAEVDTRVYNPSLNKTFPIRYQLHRVGGRWLVYDVVIEHVSLVSNYRTQFHRILTRSSYEELMRAIKNKLQELSAA